MSINVEELKNYQSTQLEQTNVQTNAKFPVYGKVVEWALIEIVILMTGIRDNLDRLANRP